MNNRNLANQAHSCSGHWRTGKAGSMPLSHLFTLLQAAASIENWMSSFAKALDLFLQPVIFISIHLFLSVRFALPDHSSLCEPWKHTHTHIHRKSDSQDSGGWLWVRIKPSFSHGWRWILMRRSASVAHATWLKDRGRSRSISSLYVNETCGQQTRWLME